MLYVQFPLARTAQTLSYSFRSNNARNLSRTCSYKKGKDKYSSKRISYYLFSCTESDTALFHKLDNRKRR